MKFKTLKLTNKIRNKNIKIHTSNFTAQPLTKKGNPKKRRKIFPSVLEQKTTENGKTKRKVHNFAAM